MRRGIYSEQDARRITAPPPKPATSGAAAVPPIAVCVRLSAPLVAPPIASFRPPLLSRLTDPPLRTVGGVASPPLPPIAVPDTETPPPVAELPKTAGRPGPLFERVAEPPSPPGSPNAFPPLPLLRWPRLQLADRRCRVLARSHHPHYLHFLMMQSRHRLLWQLIKPRRWGHRSLSRSMWHCRLCRRR